MPRNARTLALLSLALGYFTFGTTSLAVVGLGAPIAEDLHVPAARVGLLVGVFALTFAIAAPAAPTLLSRLGRKQVLIIGLALMAVGSLAAAAAPTYGLLCAARVMGALGGAAFGPASSAAGSMLVPEEHRTRALATVFGGMTAAAVLGVPLTSLLGATVGWRWTLTGTAGLALLALLLIAALLPALDRGEPPTAATYRRAVGTPGVLPMVLTTLSVMAAQFTVYGVAGAYLAARFDVPAGTVALVLLAFGIAGVLGNASGAPLHERIGGPGTVTVALAGLAVAFAALLPAPRNLPSAVALFALWAFFSQSYQAPQQARLVALLPEQRGILLALNASALNIGISLGSSAGSALLPAVGARWLPAIALLPLALAALAHLRTTRRPNAPATRAATASSP